MPGLARGTRIMTMRGEISLEELAPDELLPAYFNGSRALARIAPQKAGPMVRIAPAALAPNMPRGMLCVAASQPVLLGGVPVAAAALVNGVTITWDTKPAKSFAVQLEAPDALMAEGTWLAEPGAAPPPDYAAVEAALRPVLDRLEPPPLGTLRGFIDRIEGQIVQGWAQDIANPELPQVLEITAGDERLGEALACHYRADLAQAGIGTGHAHFAFTSARHFAPASLKVRRVADGAGINPIKRAV